MLYIICDGVAAKDMFFLANTIVCVIFATVNEKQKVKSEKRIAMNHLGCV